MTFTLLPAVDVVDGRAVGLTRGEVGEGTTHDTPLAAALAWQADGAEWIHLVDIDAAFGRGSNAELLARVIGELDVDVQLSGGIFNEASLVRALTSGCARINLATTSLENPAWCARVIENHGERIAVSLDVRVDRGRGGTARHRLAARGTTYEGADLWDTIEWLDRHGCARYIVTEVSRDGMLSGPDIELYRAVTAATSTPVIASGGISSIDDLLLLADAASTRSNLEGSIVGKALYAGRFTLRDALDATRDIGV